MDQRKRIAIYGGTFDPVHVGHLQIARTVSRLFEIDQFIFVPARLAPHKQHAQVSATLDRYAMLVLATHEFPGLCVSRVELDGPGPQYTVDTLGYFQSQFPGADLFFVMGADSWNEITSWREWEKLLSMVNHIVVTRPGYEFSSANAGPAETARVVDVRGLPQPLSQVVHSGEPKIFVTDAVMQEVSATAARGAARDNRIEDLNKLVPPAVAKYITKYRLYRNTNEA